MECAAAHPRKILNSLLWLLITGCRWRDLPRGSQWASGSAGHRRLKAWHLDGKLDDVKARLLGIAQSHGLIHWSSGAFDGSFSPLGKEAVLIQMPVSAVTTAANADERKQVPHLLDGIEVKTEKLGRPAEKLKRIAADKGYDSEELRNFLRGGGIQPQIPRKRNAEQRRGRPVIMNAPGFQAERTFSWMRRKFRRLVRWERQPCRFDSFLCLAVCFMWTKRIVG
ncbi:transposase [Desulfobulbus sp. F4]|nr:transposase [Desulfobulbus sp. F4]